MNLRYQKRVNLGKGAGLNIGKTGVSYSQRTKYGSIGTRGFSIRTGIPGLSLRGNRGKGGTGLMIMLIAGAGIVAVLVVYNLWRLLVHIIGLVYYRLMRKKEG